MPPLLLTLFTFSFLLYPVQYGTVRLPRHNLLPVMPPLDCCFLLSLSCPTTLLQERSFWEPGRLARWLKPLPTFLEGLGFNSQHPDGNPQLNETPVPGNLLSFCGLWGHQDYKCYTDMYASKTVIRFILNLLPNNLIQHPGSNLIQFLFRKFFSCIYHLALRSAIINKNSFGDKMQTLNIMAD